ncbi:recombinase family protein [Arthrobacter terricola]|uniref:Recombinase family protein n=1 Tax=Arthrobacter terricola TaxID=2547396 RepID=A0A4R5KNJ8_9MICC|nr:recombinase family protein [Arthrobacter terricola]TDF96832.1 recombinase family protein [Arthrobacter terricola]
MGNSTVIYCRISKDKKEGGGLGVKRQEEDCRRLAETNGWDVARVYVDNDISAYSGKARPEYLEMLAAMREGRIVRILAWHTDRLNNRSRYTLRSSHRPYARRLGQVRI